MLLLCVVLASCGDAEFQPVLVDATPVPRTHEALIQRGDVELKRFDVGVVETVEARALGLSAFSPLEEGVGLVLAFDGARRVCIYNGPVDYPIDAAYLDPEGSISAIEQFSAGEQNSICHDATLNVLEVRLGGLDGVRAGDRVNCWVRVDDRAPGL